MRGIWTWVVAAAAAAAIAAPGSAGAQKRKKQAPRPEDLTGDYQVKFEEIANNCSETGMVLRTGTITLAIDAAKRKKKEKDWFTVSIPIAPVMYGSPPSEGKFRVVAKRGSTGIRGVRGQFSASGRVNDGVIQFVYIAEYFSDDDKPLCTQSWNASGAKQ